MAAIMQLSLARLAGTPVRAHTRCLAMSSVAALQRSFPGEPCLQHRAVLQRNTRNSTHQQASRVSAASSYLLQARFGLQSHSHQRSCARATTQTGVHSVTPVTCSPGGVRIAAPTNVCSLHLAAHRRASRALHTLKATASALPHLQTSRSCKSYRTHSLLRQHRHHASPGQHGWQLAASKSTGNDSERASASGQAGQHQQATEKAARGNAMQSNAQQQPASDSRGLTDGQAWQSASQAQEARQSQQQSSNVEVVAATDGSAPTSSRQGQFRLLARQPSLQEARRLFSRVAKDLPQVSLPVVGLQVQPPRIVFTLRDRVTAYLRESMLVAYTALIENVVVSVVELLQLDRLLRWATPKMEDGYARITGKWYVLHDGRRISLSLVNNTAPTFDTYGLYKPIDFPFAESNSQRMGRSSSLASLASEADSVDWDTESQPDRNPSSANSSGITRQNSGSNITRSNSSSSSNSAGSSDEDATTVLGQPGSGIHISGDLSHYDSRRAHMLALCMKLVYETAAVMEDIAKYKWGCEFLGYYQTTDAETDAYNRDVEEGVQQDQQPGQTAGGKTKKDSKRAAKHRGDFIPRTRACMVGNPHAVIITFRGTEPTNLINLRSSGKISMSEREGMGRVHDGFYTALMYRSEEQGGSSLFQRLVCALQDSLGERDIFVTGHSLGGALATVFAMALHAEGYDELVHRVQGIWTFGAPRIGDAHFCQKMQEAFPNKTWRVVHGADIIAKIPPKFLLYEHCPREVYLSSFGRLVTDCDEISKWHTYEAWGYIPIHLYKTAANLISLTESPVRTMYRLALLLTLPGLSDHFPADYERLLRDIVEQEVQQSKREQPQQDQQKLSQSGHA